MVQVVEDEYHLEEDIGLNNFIAKETSPHPIKNTIPQASQTDDRETASRRGANEKSKYQLWPVTRKPAPSMTQGPSTRAGEQTLAMSISSPALRDASTTTSRRPSLKFKGKEASLTSRRKRSIPEIGLGPMTTVQEAFLDSPTIPGRFPVHERSNSAPGATWKRSPLAESGLSSIYEPNIQRWDATTSLGAVDQRGTTPRKSLKRASSLLLPQDMASLVASVNQSLATTTQGTLTTSHEDADDTPPAVPPKSPRMTLRLQTKSNGTQVATSPNLGSSSALSTPVPITAPDAGPSLSSFGSPMGHISSQFKPFSAVEGRSSPKPWVQVHSRSSSRPSPITASRNLEIGTATQVDLRQPSPDPSLSSRSMSVRSGHEREGSETSIIDRGRPTQRIDGIVKTKPAPVVLSPEKAAFAALPLGLPPSDAPSKLPKAEIESLHKHAIDQAEHFEVLNHKDVKSLTRELRTLDDRCTYLRETHNSLRSGRRNLQTRMITYLKSPRLSKFSRESMLKQEEALAELDLSIDEWVGKLERAENRRARIQERLLQHCAATLTMQTETAELITSPAFSEDQTPPRSPNKSWSPNVTMSPQTPDRRAVESIKIYADSDVYALLADIEQEMDMMAELPKLAPTTYSGA